MIIAEEKSWSRDGWLKMTKVKFLVAFEDCKKVPNQYDMNINISVIYYLTSQIISILECTCWTKLFGHVDLKGKDSDLIQLLQSFHFL